MSEAYEAHKEAARQRQADIAAKGREIGDLPPIGNSERREACEDNLQLFCEVYLRAIFCLGWSDDHVDVIKTLERVVLEGGKFCLAMPRGSGKTSLTIAAAIWAIVYGHRWFLVLVSATAPDAEQVLETIREIFESNDLLAEDFPEVCYPIRKLEGINQRCKGQTYQGDRTKIVWTGNELAFPTIAGSRSSGARVFCAGITGSIRGLNATAPDGSQRRPDLVLVNDPSTDESARSLPENNRRERTVMGAISKLAGPNKTISIAVTCTVIVENDLASRLLDHKLHPEMLGRKFSLLKSMPDRMDLWKQYREIRAQSLIDHGDIRDATAYYVNNRKAMDTGAKAAWDARKEDHHVSAIQYAMDNWAEDEESFFSELQNAPINRGIAQTERLSASDVAERYNGIPRGIVPDWATQLTAGVDIQGDSLWYVIAAWDKSMRGAVVDYGVFPEQSIAYVVNKDIQQGLKHHYGLDTFDDALECGLSDFADVVLGNSFATQSGSEMRVSMLGVDAAWTRTTDIVFQLARQRYKGKILPMFGRFVGATHSTIDQWAAGKGDKRGPGWILQKGKRGQLHSVFDANRLKTWLSAQLTANDGLTLPGDDSTSLRMLADNLTSEAGTLVEAKGRKVTEWKLIPGRDNHLQDALIMSAIGASIGGSTLPGQVTKSKRKGYSASEAMRKRRGA